MSKHTTGFRSDYALLAKDSLFQERLEKRRGEAKRLGKYRAALAWFAGRVVIEYQLYRGDDKFPRPIERMTMREAKKLNIELEQGYIRRLDERPENPGELWRWRPADKPALNALCKGFVRHWLNSPRVDMEEFHAHCRAFFNRRNVEIKE
jgi:hypothetical protein